MILFYSFPQNIRQKAGRPRKIYVNMNDDNPNAKMRKETGNLRIAAKI